MIKYENDLKKNMQKELSQCISTKMNYFITLFIKKS